MAAGTQEVGREGDKVLFLRFLQTLQPPMAAAREPRSNVPGSGTAVCVKATASLAVVAMAKPERLMEPVV